MKSVFFKRSEFACKCGCGFDTVDAQLLQVLEAVRKRFDVPVYINSAARCKAHNEAIGGKPTSQHLIGRAADIRIPGFEPEYVASYVEQALDGKGGIGIYETFVHVDTRAGKARWTG